MLQKKMLSTFTPKMKLKSLQENIVLKMTHSASLLAGGQCLNALLILKIKIEMEKWNHLLTVERTHKNNSIFHQMLLLPMFLFQWPTWQKTIFANDMPLNNQLVRVDLGR